MGFYSNGKGGFLGGGSAAGGLDLTSGGTIGGDVTINGSLTMGSGGVVLLDNGSAGTPSLSFASDPDTGVYRVGANDLGFTAGGTVRLDITSARALFAVVGAFPDGAVGAPGVAFGSDLDCGLYRIGANDWGLTSGGVKIAELTSTALVAALTQAWTGSAAQDLVAGTTIAPTSLFKKITATGGAITLTSTPTISAGVDGQLLVLLHDGSANNIILQDKTAIASACNMISSTSKTLTPHDYIMMMYNGTTSQWDQLVAVTALAA